jgi:hypothetical protein
MSVARLGSDQWLFGLRVRSNIPIPSTMTCDDGLPDVIVTAGAMPEWLPRKSFRPCLIDRDEAPYGLSAADDAFLLEYADGTRFVITREAIWMTWRDPLGFDDACTYLVGAAFALLVRIRGAACLHAACVSIGGRTIAFAGASGTGKSTVAAAMLQRGGALIAEDVLPLVRDGEGIVAVPTWSGVRLWPDAVELLMNGRNALPRISPTWDKRLLASDVAPAPSRLSAVFFLEDRDDALTPSAAAMRLVASSYRPEMLDAAMRRNEFDIYTELASSVAIRTLARHDPPVVAEIVANTIANV